MPSQHKHRPIPFRPPERDRARLLAYAEHAGKPVNRVLAEALAAYLNAAEASASLPQVLDWAERACRAQEAINELGAGPPGTAAIPNRQETP